MDALTYSAAAASTAIYPDAGTGATPAVLYVSLGIVGESTEVLQKHLADDLMGLAAELGDVAWYLARAHTELGELFDPAAARDVVAHSGPEDLLVAAGRIAETAKKTLRDGGGVITPDRLHAFKSGLETATAAWFRTVTDAGLHTGDVLAGNAAKLADRNNRGVLSGSGDNR